MVVGEDESVFADDEARAGSLRELRPLWLLAAGRCPPPKNRSSRSSSPPNCVICVAFCRDSVRMFTTAGLIDFAMVRNVEASMAPLSGALFAEGAAIDPVCADDAGDSSSFEAITIPTATEATAMSRA